MSAKNQSYPDDFIVPCKISYLSICLLHILPLCLHRKSMGVQFVKFVFSFPRLNHSIFLNAPTNNFELLFRPGSTSFLRTLEYPLWEET